MTRAPLRITNLDWMLTLLPAPIWAWLVTSRARIITPHCAIHPTPCTPETVAFWDRPAIGAENRAADAWSFVTQDGAGIIAFLVMMALAIRRWRDDRRLTWVALLLWLQTTLWNGLITEVFRVTIQRPRPFVYVDPFRLGADPAHYTSMTSGHTSFTAAIAFAQFFFVAHCVDSPRWRAVALTYAILVTAATGALRVAAGRHFLTDTLGGALSGIVVALALAWAHGAITSRTSSGASPSRA